MPTAELAMKRMGDYELVELIAVGNFGSVFKARHAITDQIVAVKVVHPRVTQNPVLLKRFEQEFRTANRLDHPHIVRALEFGRHEGIPYLVMEYVGGKSVGATVELLGPMPVEEAIRVIEQVAEGLHQAHQQGMIHRDVKPDNILLTEDGQAKLTDLGLVKEVAVDHNLTHTGRGLGTPHYMAPEQFREAKKADIRCDIYSLGATLYTMVTGRPPFDSPNPIDSFMQKIHNDFKPPRRLVRGLPRPVDETICRAMSANPLDRPATCRDFVEALRGKPPVPVQAAPAKKPARMEGERRATVRFPSRKRGKCQAIGGEQRVRWIATVVDVSEGGMALILRRRFEPRTVLDVELLDANGLPQRVLVRVVRVEPLQKRKWKVGCVFAAQITADEVQALV